MKTRVTNNWSKAKRKATGEWVEGFYFEKDGKAYIIYMPETIIHCTYAEEPDVVDFDLRAYEVVPETCCLYSGKEYMDGEKAYEGDVFESQGTGIVMVLRYGVWQAYCPADDEFMECVGFYAEADGYPQMPIGDLHEYALKTGSVFDEPELSGDESGKNREGAGDEKATVYYEIDETRFGCRIRKPNPDGGVGHPWWYVAHVHQGEYEWVCDFTFARRFSRATAEKHLKVLQQREESKKLAD